MNHTRTTLAALTLTTLTLAVGGTAAADTATCVVTLQPWNNTVYQAAYIDADGGMHVLEHRQNGAAKPATDYEIPADFDTVLWATKRGVIDGPSSFYDHLHNGGGCTFDTPYGGIPGKQDSVVIRVGHTPTTTSTTVAPTTTAPASTTSTAPTTSTTVTSLPPVTVTRVTELPPATLPPLPEQPSTTLPDGLDLVGLIPSPTPYTAVPTPPVLPATGTDMGIKVMLGAGLIFFGGLLTALRRHVTSHQHGRKFDAS